MATNHFKKGLVYGAISGIILSLSFLGFVFYKTREHQKISENIASSKNIADLNLKLKDLNGNAFDLNSIKNKTILLNFWATWCAPCLKEMPLLQQINDKVKEDAVFIAISDDSIDAIKSFKEKGGYTFIFLRSEENISEKIGALPTTFILNKNKTIALKQVGEFEGKDVQKIVSLMKQESLK